MLYITTQPRGNLLCPNSFLFIYKYQNDQVYSVENNRVVLCSAFNGLCLIVLRTLVCVVSDMYNNIMGGPLTLP